MFPYLTPADVLTSNEQALHLTLQSQSLHQHLYIRSETSVISLHKAWGSGTFHDMTAW
jgi:hypothetical protein